MNGQVKNLIDIQRRKNALNKVMTKMTLTEFKQALIDMGYKKLERSDNEHTRYKKHNKMVTIQSLCGENIYFDIERKGYQVEHSQFDVKDFKKALANIKKFERKMGR